MWEPCTVFKSYKDIYNKGKFSTGMCLRGRIPYFVVIHFDWSPWKRKLLQIAKAFFLSADKRLEVQNLQAFEPYQRQRMHLWSTEGFLAV